MVSDSFVVFLAHLICTGILFTILELLLPTWVLAYYTCTANVLLWLLISGATLSWSKKRFLSGNVIPRNKAVVITGCDTGFGHLLAKRLDSSGYHVFASCLLPSGGGAEELRKSCSSNVKIFGLDVTSDESVKQAVNFVRENLGESKLWAVVNNAGIARTYPVEFTPMEEYITHANINTFGVVRVTKAFLPMIRKTKGRIVNLTSIFGRIYSPWLSAYTMSKFAAAAFNDCLRREMYPWDVRVISVEPELFRTNLLNVSAVTKFIENAVSKTSDDIIADYGQEFVEGCKRTVEVFNIMSSDSLEKVVDDLEAAVSAEHPDICYKTRRNWFHRAFLCLMEYFPASIVDFIFDCIMYYLIPKLMPKLAEQ